MRRISILFLFLLSGALLVQLPATRPLRRVLALTQSDGSVVNITKGGNAFLNYYVTTDGIALERNARGDFCYARLAADGCSLESTGWTAHDASVRTTAEANFVNGLRAENQRIHLTARRLSEAHQVRIPAAGTDGINAYGQKSNGSISSIGSPTIPIIMVHFPDRDFMEITTERKVTRMFNEEGYADEQHCVGSVRDYFMAQSQGLFTPTFEIIADVETANGYATYGQSAVGGSSAGTLKLLREVLGAAGDQGVDFSRYVDEAGAIPLIAIYYAGPGAHNAYEEDADNYIYAHYQTVNVKVQNLTVRSCLLGNEAVQSYKDVEGDYPEVTGSSTDGIGVFCHEFGHALGLPDFYYTGNDNDIAFSLLSMDYWSVMDYGQWYADGFAPVGYNAYERAFMGWQEVKELTPSDDTCRLYAYHQAEAREGTTCYKLTNPDNPREYFLLENRQPSTWYPEEMGSGLLVTHVDYDAAEWGSNPHSPNNNPDHQRFTYVPADGKKQGVNSVIVVDGVEQWKEAPWSECQTDLFPRTNGMRELSSTTLPAWYAYHTGTLPGHAFYNIAETNGHISFVYGDKPGELPTPDYDLNGDGRVDVGDVTQLISIVLAGTQSTQSHDLNADGAVDIGDVTLLVSVILQ